jgi:hypothetical protein
MRRSSPTARRPQPTCATCAADRRPLPDAGSRRLIAASRSPESRRCFARAARRGSLSLQCGDGMGKALKIKDAVGRGVAAGSTAGDGRAGGGADVRDRARARLVGPGGGGAAGWYGAPGPARRGGALQRRGACRAARPAEAPAAAVGCRGGGRSHGAIERGPALMWTAAAPGRAPTSAAGWRASTARPTTRQA